MSPARGRVLEVLGVVPAVLEACLRRVLLGPLAPRGRRLPVHQGEAEAVLEHLSVGPHGGDTEDVDERALEGSPCGEDALRT